MHPPVGAVIDMLGRCSGCVKLHGVSIHAYLLILLVVSLFASRDAIALPLDRLEPLRLAIFGLDLLMEVAAAILYGAIVV